MPYRFEHECHICHKHRPTMIYKGEPVCTKCWKKAEKARPTETGKDSQQ